MPDGPQLVGKEWDRLDYAERQLVKAGQGDEVIEGLERKHALWLRVQVPMQTAKVVLLTIVTALPATLGGAWRVPSLSLAAALLALLVTYLATEQRAHRRQIGHIEAYVAASRPA